jgi:hypothetical protein
MWILGEFNFAGELSIQWMAICNSNNEINNDNINVRLFKGLEVDVESYMLSTALCLA